MRFARLESKNGADDHSRCGTKAGSGGARGGPVLRRGKQGCLSGRGTPGVGARAAPALPDGCGGRRRPRCASAARPQRARRQRNAGARLPQECGRRLGARPRRRCARARAINASAGTAPLARERRGRPRATVQTARTGPSRGADTERGAGTEKARMLARPHRLSCRHLLERTESGHHPTRSPGVVIPRRRTELSAAHPRTSARPRRPLRCAHPRPRPAQLGDGADVLVVGAQQRVGGADRHDGDAGGVRRRGSAPGARWSCRRAP